MTVQDLRDVLRERAEGPSPANPARHEQVGAHIRRTRRRRRVAGGAAAAVAVLLGVWLVPGAADQPQKATVASSVAKLPERFTAPDGTEYRRIAATAVKAAGGRKAVITVPLSGKPLDVAGVCEGVDNRPPRVSTGARTWPPMGFRGCSKVMQLLPLPVPENAEEATVTFDTATSGSACVQAGAGGPCEPVKAKRGDWSLAVYEWTPPAEPVEPAPLKDLPRRLDGWKLADSKTGLWPQDTTARFEIVGTGRKLAFDQVCGGDLAGRVLVRTSTGLTGSPQSSTCPEWKSGPFPMAMTEFPAVPKGKRMVITVRISVIGETTNRPIRWSFGLYSK
ncbi:hypothetical protein LDL08_16375 [Nonomuraea glycinis]|uniref:Uncharacterized protein n=1 Tax=Nonomuraea glycinis TaxID=2047744 RepID=A0A918A401_9ACTN|nr:hypothetical protein [Nonomuraea glycinis]MCA2177767.1 hypothetical protein [Nonomuraea glycinis]GGP06717.1 hypothetical protein GCM10012278_31580 [Nonomuraea glycinis]